MIVNLEYLNGKGETLHKTLCLQKHKNVYGQPHAEKCAYKII